MRSGVALEGVRVLDMGMFMSGPHCGGLLADLGAEVIKVESCRHPDPLRIQGRGVYPRGEPGERSWNRSGMINERNRNKLGITLDLTTPKGKETFKKLVKISDVVLENFASRTMLGFGLDYPVLVKVNSHIIMLSLASQGQSGPEKDYVSYGPVLAQTSGLTHFTGYADRIAGEFFYDCMDVMAATMGAATVIAALCYRQRIGKGMHIDLSQREVGTCIIGEVMMDYFMNRRTPKPTGNRHAAMAPHGCYPCRGEDEWVTIAITSDTEWKKFCQVIGRPELAEDKRFSNLVSRWSNQDELDIVITEWSKERDHYAAMRSLQEAGIAAGAVLTTKELFSDPHLAQREFFKAVTHPEAGAFSYKGGPIRLSSTPCRTQSGVQMPAPCLGEHNHYVYGTLLGMTKTEIEELEGEGIIGTVPRATDLEFT